jgi:hypothetical protein
VTKIEGEEGLYRRERKNDVKGMSAGRYEEEGSLMP